MKKLKPEAKKQIYGGISFWSASMGISLLTNVIMQFAGLITSWVNHANQSDANHVSNERYNNSWSAGYGNSFHNNGSPLMLRFGLTPSKSGILTTMPDIFW